MPFWNKYVYTKPEVDDDDLPLPEHRIFDDDGCVKEVDAATVAAAVVAAWRRSSKSSDTSVNAKKSPAHSPKTRASLLKSVGAKPTTPLRIADLKAPPSQSPRKAASRSSSPHESAANSPSRRLVRAASPEPQPDVPTRSTPRKAAAKKTPSKKSSPKQSSSKRAASRSPARARSPSPAKPKPVVKTSASRRRSRSRSSSRRKVAATPSKTPSPKWTLAALKEFAKDNSIQLSGAKTKAGVLSAIQGSS